MNARSYSIEIEPVDISAYKEGNTGVNYVTTFDSNTPGPHVMVMALTHGNELCGAITLDYLFRNNIRPIQGKLTFGFHNVAAYLTFDPNNPIASRFVNEDLNRVWSLDILDGDRDTVETRRAREMRPIIDTVDLLLDIHSMTNDSPALTLCGPLVRGRDLALMLKSPTYVVADSGHAAGKRLRDYGSFGDPAARQNALLLEAGQHWRADSVMVSMDVTLRFLRHTGVISEDVFQAHIASDDADLADQKYIKVSGPHTIASNVFNWADDYTGMELIEKAGTVIGRDGDCEVVTPYDNCILIMPNKLKTKGHSAVRFGRLIPKATEA